MPTSQAESRPPCPLDAALAAVAAGTATRAGLAAALNCALLTECIRRVSCLEKVSDLVEAARSRGIEELPMLPLDSAERRHS